MHGENLKIISWQYNLKFKITSRKTILIHGGHLQDVVLKT